MDPTGAMWLSVDPMWEKNHGITPYNYCLGNPVKLVDPDGNIPIPVIIWGIFEIGSTIYDYYDAYNTLTDDNASNFDKGASTAGVIAGFFLPGGGYGTISKQLYKVGNRTFKTLEASQRYLNVLREFGGKSKIADALWDSGKKGMGNNKLRDALGLVKGDKRQAHHLIPRELIEKNKTLQDAIEEGFDFNGKINGIALNTSKHSGSHLNYTSKIEELIEIANSNKTLKTAKSKMEWVANKARNLINESEGKINNIFDE